MNDKTESKEFSTSVLFVCLTNLATFAFFCYLAVYFHHWWIALFAIILHNSIDIKPRNHEDEEDLSIHEVQCDFCGEILYVEDVENCVHREMRQQGWKRALVNKEWKDICPYCFSQLEEAYRTVIDKEESKGGES